MSEHDSHDPLRPGPRRFVRLPGRTTRRSRCVHAGLSLRRAEWMGPRRGAHGQRHPGRG